MSPEQLAKSGSESGHQKALFAWANMARLYGFKYADNMATYSLDGQTRIANYATPVAALRWLHSSPNGGLRDPKTAARMKAEGAKPGIPDVFLPVPMIYTPYNDVYHGLYIELKKPDKPAKISVEQSEFAAYCHQTGYCHEFAYGWRQAADYLKEYLGYSA